MIGAKFGRNRASDFGKEDKNVKSLWKRQQQKQTTDKFWSEKLTWVSGSGELKTFYQGYTMEFKA